MAEGPLLEGPDGPRLRGARCGACGAVAFPFQRSCPRCTAEAMEEHALAAEGTLWSWTIQGFAPKSPPYGGDPASFEPYGVGYIELAGEIRVEARLTIADPDRLAIGMAMRLTRAPSPGGGVTFAFEPAEAPA